MYEYKLLRIVFNDGTIIEPGNLTVIVGPNNSGKSRALKEILLKTTTSKSVPSIVAKDVEWTLPKSLQELRDAYIVERYQDQNNNWSFRTLAPDLCSEFSTFGMVWPTQFETHFQKQPNITPQFFSENFGSAMVAFLTTEHRLQLVKESPSPAHERQAANLLQMLYYGGSSAENLVRELVKRAFSQEIALDFTVLQRLLLRVGDDFSTLPVDPREARSVMLREEKLDEQGDGIRSFVGIIVAMLSVRRSLFLIDEPEAFLHPPQAFRIGEFLAEQANKSRQIIIATHSADVLRGILSKTQDVSILRIDRIRNTNSFRLLDSKRLKELVNDPLLSSARVLDGLFYSGAVVVEADSDARFYQATSHKRRSDFDLHFVNADNKQTVPHITKMYRDMGVRCAGIVDFDVLNNRVEFEKQLRDLALSEEESSQALAIRDDIARAAKEIPPAKRLENIEQQMTLLMSAIRDTQSKSYSTKKEAEETKEGLLRQIESRCRELADSTKGWKQFKQHGRAALSEKAQARFDHLSKVCAAKGLFINPCGELESMLVGYGISHTTDKRGWITQALNLLPNLEVNDEKHPWKFIKTIHTQLFGKAEN
jgi:ABC-type ATPase involved in cell division